MGIEFRKSIGLTQVHDLLVLLELMIFRSNDSAFRLGHLIWGPILCETVHLTPGENSHRQSMPSIMIQNDATTSNDQDAPLESLW
jgi:hypothetical protein